MLAFIIIAIPGVVIIYGVWAVANDVRNYFTSDINYWVNIRKPLDIRYRRILTTYCAYYKCIGQEEKVAFEYRLKRFLYSKRFIPRNLPMVTDEMKVLISATAVQLTFGLPEIYLQNFDKILVYPDAYYSHISKQYHLGEVNPRAGIIVISWKAFVDGFGDLEDSFNVGIHEMAHALHFENRIKNEEYDPLNPEGLARLNHITQRELPKIKSANHFLRPYAGTNEHEFFAVVLEYFFEQPVEVFNNMNDLYVTLVMLLRQDPIKLYKLVAR